MIRRSLSFLFTSFNILTVLFITLSVLPSCNVREITESVEIGFENGDYLADASSYDLSGNIPRYPELSAVFEHKPLILSRIDNEPYKRILEHIKYVSSLEKRVSPDNIWDVDINGYNAKIAQANAFLAWLFDDIDAAQKAIELLESIETNFEEREERTDIDVNMPQVLMGYINALDFLKGTIFLEDNKGKEIKDNIIAIAKKLYDAYVEDEFTRTIQYNYSQNNHNIRAASAIGYAAIAFKEYADARRWANWAFSELDFFFSDQNHYFMPDGSISEGPFYGMLAMQSAAALFIAISNLKEEIKVKRDCRSRIYSDPWQDYKCNEGEVFIFKNPLYKPIFNKFFDWYISIRLPWGELPPLEDSMFKTYAGTIYLTTFGGGGIHYWAWENNRDFPYLLDQSDDMSIYNLIYYDEKIKTEQPEWTTRFMPEAGHIVFRSGWDYDAVWMLVTAESGSQRKAAHDHVDGTSFSLAAYGEYLLIDPGYVKDEDSKIFKVKTAQPQAHNLILIDGKAAPEKEPFPSYGDSDAWLMNFLDGRYIDYVEAHQYYQSAHINRSFVFVDNRYFVIADFVLTDLQIIREHRFRLNGYAGYGSGGRFIVNEDSVKWEREKAGIDVYISSPDPGLRIIEPPFASGEIPHIHRFDINRETVEHGVIDAIIDGISPSYLTLLLPYRVGVTGRDGNMIASKLKLPEGVSGYKIEYDNNVDIIILRKENADKSIKLSDTLEIETDAGFIMFRYLNDLSFLLASKGTYLILNGERLIKEDFLNRAVLLEK